MEDSDEEEGDLCRICQMGQEQESNPLIQPCRCTGSLQYVHQECIKRWLRSKIGSGISRLLMWVKLLPIPYLTIKVNDFFFLFSHIFSSGTNLEAITTCELCKEKLRLNIDNFDIQELYRTHVQVSLFTFLGKETELQSSEYTSIKFTFTETDFNLTLISKK